MTRWRSCGWKIENCPDGVGEGKVRRGGPAKQLTRLEGEGRSTFPSLSKYCQVEEGAERDEDLRGNTFSSTGELEKLEKGRIKEG